MRGLKVVLYGDANLVVRISGLAPVELTLPADYIRGVNEGVSPNYETASVRSEIALRPGSERIEIKDI